MILKSPAFSHSGPEPPLCGSTGSITTHLTAVTGRPLLKRTEFREESGVILALSWISQFGFHTGLTAGPGAAKGPWTLCSSANRRAPL